MKEPLVVAVMLTKDRPELAARAVRSFREQTYQNKRLYVYDTGKTPCTDSLPDGYPDFNIVYHRGLSDEIVSIGKLRNRAIWWAARPSATSEPDVDIIITWDDDDYSHPNRIAEQVAHLQSSGADVVGYNELLFWRTGYMFEGARWENPTGQAWLYKNVRADKSPGTTLCFWRKTWEAKPFPDLPTSKGGTGEDSAWLQGMNVAAVSSLVNVEMCAPSPRMIASIHGGNTMPYDLEGIIERGGATNWKRVPEWDDYCRGRMAL